MKKNSGFTSPVLIPTLSASTLSARVSSTLVIIIWIFMILFMIDFSYATTLYNSDQTVAGVGGNTYWASKSTVGDGTATTTKVQFKQGNSGSNYYRPGQTSPENTYTIDSTPKGYGWITENALSGNIPSGAWVFKVYTKNSRSGMGPGYIGINVFKYCAGINQQLFYIQGTTNVMGTTSQVGQTITTNQPLFSVDGCRIKFEYWLTTANVQEDNSNDLKNIDTSQFSIDFPTPTGENLCSDSDSDSYTASSCGGTDCDDTNSLINPGATEICGNSIDENCDSQVNENCGFSTDTVVQAEDGINNGFTVSGGYVYTDTDNTNSISYDFNVVQSGQYIIETRMNSPTTGSNSFFIGLDGETAQGINSKIYDSIVSSSDVTDNIRLRGSSSNDTYAEFDPMIWTLNSGSHTFTFYGREKNTKMNYLTLKTYSELTCSDSDSDSYTASSCGGTDCDDTNPSINPAASEVCSNAVDDNCDGLIDEGCACTPGAIQTCGSSVGACELGNQTCSDSGVWGDCIGDIIATEEICGNNLDDNCNGVVDDVSKTVTCGKGICEKEVTQTCVSGVLTPACIADSPIQETCNKKDDDCDGSVDDDIFKECGSNIGECIPGLSVCSDGKFLECIGGTGPVKELCDSLDNDCDGLVDEDNVCLIEVSPICIEEWICDDWSDCVNANSSVRKCIDKKSCGTEIYKPLVEKSCFSNNIINNEISAVDKKKIDSQAFIILVILVSALGASIAWIISIKTAQ